MKSLGQDASALPIRVDDDGAVLVEDEPIGKVDGFRFIPDQAANHADRKMLLAAAEKGLPRILGEKAVTLAQSECADVELQKAELRWNGVTLAKLQPREGEVQPTIILEKDLAALPDHAKAALQGALETWLAAKLAPLEPLAKLHEAARDPNAGSEARALLLNLISGHGHVAREKAGIEHLPKEMRPFLRKIGVTFGALDIFAPALLKPAPRQLLSALGVDHRRLERDMLPVIKDAKKLPSGYRHAGNQAIRLDLAEKIFRAAHETRNKAQSSGNKRAKFMVDLALPISIGLEEANAIKLLGQGGFRVQRAPALTEGMFGPPKPDRWEWRPSRRRQHRTHQHKGDKQPREGNAFAGLADLIR